MQCTPTSAIRAATCYFRIIQPSPWVTWASREGKLGAGEHGLTDLARSDAFSKSRRALLETEHMGHSEKNLGLAGSFHHLAAFAGIHA